MPDRIIRDEILDSDRYWDLASDSARLLFDHFMLVADDLGNAEATNSFIRRRLLQATKPDDQAIGALLEDLARVDIARPYAVGPKRYVHIPRFRQRLRSYKRVNPRPPASVECSEISKLIAELSDSCPTDDGHLHALAVEGRKEGSEGRKDKKEVRQSTPAVSAASPANGSSAKPDVRGSRLSETAPLPDDWKLWAIRCYPKLTAQEVVRIWVEFRNYWSDVPGQRGLHVRWFQTWQNNVHRRMKA